MTITSKETGLIDFFANNGKGFFDNERKIFSYCKDRRDSYFNSQCFQGLRRRRDRLSESYNLKIGQGNWKSKIVLPVVKEQMRIIRAVTLGNFRNDPIYSFEPINDTPLENSVNIGQVCMMNLKHTNWRNNTWRYLVNDAAIFGTGIQFCAYHEEESKLKRTVLDAYGMSQRVAVPQTIQQVRHYNINLLNYFQNPNSLDQESSDFQGHIDQVSLSELVNSLRNEGDRYIGKNLQETIKIVRDGSGMKDSRRYADNASDVDLNRFFADRTHWWGKLNIDGNEGDDTIYYVQMIGDKIVRFQADVYDMGLKPYCIFNFEKRYDFWWGNAESENLLPHENYMNLLLSITADSALERTQNLKFYRKGQIDPSELNNRAINNGYVPVELLSNQNIGDVIFETQGQEKSLQGVDFMLKEMKESAQRMSTRPDFQRTAANGGPANTTATAASMMQGESNLMQSDFLESFSGGLAQMGKIDSTILMQMLDGEIKVRPDIKEVSRVLTKPEILGDYSYVVKTSFQKNNAMEAQRMMGIMNYMLQLKMSGLPEASNINIVKLGRDWLKDSDLGTDVDDIWPQQAQMAQPGNVPSQLPQQAQMAQMMANGGGNAPMA